MTGIRLPETFSSRLFSGELALPIDETIEPGYAGSPSVVRPALTYQLRASRWLPRRRFSSPTR